MGRLRAFEEQELEQNLLCCVLGLGEAQVTTRSTVTALGVSCEDVGVGGLGSSAFPGDDLGSAGCPLRNYSTARTVGAVYSCTFSSASTCSRCLMFVFKQRSGESVKVHQLDVAIPLHLKSQLRKGPPLGGGEGEAEAADTMPFAMLTRKGNKQQVRRRPLRTRA